MDARHAIDAIHAIDATNAKDAIDAMDARHAIDATNAKDATDAKWYCIHTKRYKETWVARQLMESCDEIYLPLLRQQRMIRRQRKWVIEPLFPGYLFARFVMEERFRAVRYTSGVVRVVSTIHGEPIEVAEAIIFALRQRSTDGYVEVQLAPLFPGEELEINHGPFEGMRALFQQELKAGERVAVLLEILSSRVRVELPRAYVEKKSDATRKQLVA
jgi:transcriptional antiterminator RfaH